MKKLHIVEEAEMDHLELEPLVNKGNVAYLEQAIVKRESEFTLKWDKVFQDKPILMSELKCLIETTDDVSNNHY